MDHEVRWCVLKLADILIRGVEETAPTVKLHLPPTPVIETPAQLPTVKVPFKARPLKAGGPPHTKNPMIPPSHIPPRLKLPGSSQPHVEHPLRTPGTPISEQSKKAGIVISPILPKAKPPKSRPPKSDRPSHVPKAQSSGMPLTDLRASRSALKKLLPHKHAVLFLQPVDPIRDHAPRYVVRVVLCMMTFKVCSLQATST